MCIRDRNEGTGNVSWNVVLNQDGRDISGMTFRDAMTYTVKGQTKPYAPTEIVNLQVTAYSLSEAGQYNWVGNVTAAFSPLIDRVGDELIIHFPAVDGWPGWPEGLDPTWTYQITYETPFPEEAAIEEAVAFQNTAWLNDYTVTVEWNGTVPEQGYGLVKEVYASDLNTGTDVGTVTWLSTISYPSGDYDLEHLAYVDWIQDLSLIHI